MDKIEASIDWKAIWLSLFSRSIVLATLLVLRGYFLDYSRDKTNEN